MKILRLRALNINSLKGETVIDFSRWLEENTLFAITGPTGSGKSTILDIITCALYGQTPRLKNPNELMSHYCWESLCEVEFEINGQSYRSTWTQKRAHKKPDGKFQSAKMDLVDLKTDKVIVSGSSKVTQHIEALSGLDFDRFTQSMMLAQGSFDAFLKAKESDRSLLLEKITGTKIYTEISKRVYAQYSLYDNEIKLEEKVLEGIEFLDEEQLYEKKAIIAEHKKQKEIAHSQLKEMTIILNWVEQLFLLRKNQEQYTKAFEAIAQEKECKKEDFIKLDLAEKALVITPLYRYQEVLAGRIAKDTQTLENLTQELTVLANEIAHNNQIKKAKEEALHGAKRGFDEAMSKLKKARAIEVKEGESTKRLSVLEKESKRTQEQETLLQQRLEALNHEFEALEKKLKEADNYLSENQKDKGLISTLPVIKEQVERFKLERLKLNSLEANQQTLALHFTHHESYITELQEHIANLRIQREQALLIQKYEVDRAKILQGEPCFVCGSTHHPYIENHPLVDVDKTQIAIDKKVKELQSVEEHQRQIQQLEKEILHTHKLLEESRKRLSNEWQKYDLVWNEEGLEEAYTMLFTREMSYVEIQKEQEKIEKLLNRLKLDKKESETQWSSLQLNIREISTNIIEVREQLKLLSAERRAIDWGAVDLDAYETTLKEQFGKIETEAQEANTKQRELIIQEESSRKQQERLREALVHDSMTLQKGAKKLTQALNESGFKSIESLLEATMMTKEREELKQVCQEINDKYQEMATLKEDTTERLKVHEAQNMSSQSIETLKEQQTMLQLTLNDLQHTLGRDEKELEINNANYQKHQKRMMVLQAQREKFKVWAKLKELIGSADGRVFAKYAQGITLDHLIGLANQHLVHLSQRYLLVRAKGEKQLLEIEIVDGFQGNVVRSVSTLSGGESFIVSLSLALGLSALASQKISIDSLFLDEGFGTLDTQSLEMALNALNLLQSRGKMIGIISHVEALKEYLPLQIKVLPKGDGTSKVELS